MVLPRRISLLATVLFPRESREFESHFKDSTCREGLCFAFSIFFSQRTPINPTDPECRSQLLKLQALHRASVKAYGMYLDDKSREIYNITFTHRCDFTTTDLTRLSTALCQWAHSNPGKETQVVISTSATSTTGITKHWTPLTFVPTSNIWEVGDTGFCLSTSGEALRHPLIQDRLGDYLNWQISRVVKSPAMLRKITLIQLASIH